MFHTPEIESKKDKVQGKSESNGKFTISKSLKMLLIVFRYCFGLDFGSRIVNKTKMHYLLICVTYLVACIIFSILIVYSILLGNNYMFWYLIYVVQYFGYFLVTITIKYNLCDFLEQIRKIDGRKSSENDYFGILLLTYTLGMFIAKSFTAALSCIYNEDYACDTFIILYNILIMATLGTDILPYAIIILYYYTYDYLRYINTLYLTSKIDLDTLKSKYTALADCFDNIRPFYETSLITELLSNIPKLIGLLWFCFFYINYNLPWMACLTEYVFSLQIIIQICVPSIIAEMINNQMHTLQLSLHNQRIYEEDERKIYQLSRVLQYIESRPLNRDIWGVVPADLRLPVKVFNLLVTYFIVLIQYTHLA